MKCSVCGNDIDVQPNGWTQGNNAQPINSGRCCSVCNTTVVIPQRLRDAGIWRSSLTTFTPNGKGTKEA